MKHLIWVVALMSGTAWAQLWPARNVTFIVASAPGAGVDNVARIVAERLSTRIGHAVVVENRPGASGMIAAAIAAKAPPNGHSLFLFPETVVIAPHVLSRQAATVDVIHDFVPVILATSTVLALAVNAQLPVHDVRELVALAKRESGLAYTAGQIGSPMHVLVEQLKKAAAIDMTFVPYNGVAQSVAAALGGQVNVIWMPLAGQLQHFRSGALRPLAQSGPRRFTLLPDVPSMKELGYGDIEHLSLVGIAAPAGTPDAIVATINRELDAVLAEHDVRARILASANTPEGGPPAVLADALREHDRRYRRLAAELKIRAEEK
jgi:tripartite-type tricarboxylate transporter receptor subunit TctC